MAWTLEGTYFENCSCDTICPCTWSALTAKATHDRCLAMLAFHIDRGDVEARSRGGFGCRPRRNPGDDYPFHLHTIPRRRRARSGVITCRWSSAEPLASRMPSVSTSRCRLTPLTFFAPS